ncbi:MAG: serine/threonine protein kinase [Myxococcota bacterium]|nr:serine/threonine protein kinase [Myxococcota bacterium]
MRPRALATASMIAGRYILLEPFARGGMATVHFGRQLGVAGTGRVVAIKRLHPHLASEPEFVSMFLDEARIAARVRHPNVVSMLDAIRHENELLLVMDYIHGESLARVVAQSRANGSLLPLPVASAIVADVLAGLQAAHAATSEHGNPLDLVHRDVSPQNVIVGADGVARVVDFGIAKAAGRLSVTCEPALKGKIAYMAPEQLRAQPVSSRTDVYAASVVLWECLTGRSLVAAGDHAAVEQVLLGDFDPPSRWRRDLPLGVDDVVMRGLAREPANRYSTARDMALALQAVVARASVFEVGAWMQNHLGEPLTRQAASVAAIEKMQLGEDAVAPADARRSATSIVARGRSTLPKTGVAIAIASLLVGSAFTGALALKRSPAGTLTWVSEAPPHPVEGSVVATPVAVVAPVPPLQVIASPEVSRLGLRPVRGAPVPDAGHPSLPVRPESCRVPYELDFAGHRHYTRACFEGD